MSSGLIHSFSAKAADVARLKARRIERMLSHAHPPAGFFDRYPRFFSSSVTNAAPNRLNQRHRALVAANEALIRGQRILDLASHDGRWSFAAAMAGARHVVGVEARDHLVAAGEANMRAYEVAPDRYRLILGDVFTALDGLAAGSFDVVFCFGFLYHTIDHLPLLAKIARLKPAHVILDTEINRSRDAVVRLRFEEVEEEADAVAIPGFRKVVGGVPSRRALEMLMASLGWSWSYFHWHSAGIRCWDQLSDYHDGDRVTLVAALPRN